MAAVTVAAVKGPTSAVVLGASGSVGGKLVHHLLRLSQMQHVLLINRRSIPEFQDPRVHQHLMPEMTVEAMQGVTDLIKKQGAEAAFITMGVGAASTATPEQLEMVDVTLPTVFSKAAKEAGAAHMGLLTAVGADYSAGPTWYYKGTGAGGGLYAHLKGKVEKNIREHQFQSTAIYQPGTLVGAAATPPVWGWMAPKLDWMVPVRFNSIDIDALGQAMAYGPIAAPSAPVTTYVGQTLFDLSKAAKEAPVWSNPASGADVASKSE
ncbi:unnamed protein product [Effrenium voratum]|nr:unnamed protein product [Effrenium voratum]